MKKRTNLRVIPNKNRFVKITDNNDRVWEFKVPSALQGMKIFKSSQELIKSLSSFNNIGMVSILSMVKDAGPEVLSMFGAVVGISWHSSEYDLDAKKSDFKDLTEYGEAVFEELYEEDVTLEDVIMMAVAIGKVWWENNNIQEEALNRLGFTIPKTEQTNSSNSTSE